MDKPGIADWRTGNALFEESKFAEAVDAYDRAIAANPEEPDYRFNRALALVLGEKPGKALPDLHWLLEVEPESANVYRMLGEARAKLGESRLALQNYRHALKLETDPAQRPALESSISALETGSAPHPGKSQGAPVTPAPRTTPTVRPAEETSLVQALAYKSLASVKAAAQQVHSDETLVVSLERRLNSLPHEGSPTDRVGRAVLLSALHRPEAAAEWVEVLRTCGPHAEALRYAVQALRETGQWEELDRVVRRYDAVACEEVVAAHAQALLALNRAADALRALESLSAPGADALRAKAGCLLAMGRRALAVEAAESALRAAPRDPRARNLTCICDGSWFASKRPLDHVVGLDLAKRSIRDRIVLPLVVPELYLEGPMVNQLLLVGPPGCGKTTLARAVAQEANARYLCLHLTSILNMYTGNSEANLAAFFKEAKDSALEGPVVVLIDEIDSIAIAREKLIGSGEHRLVAHLMDELDGAKAFPNLAILAASNLPLDLDSAVIRSGRLGTPVYVGAPGEDGRRVLLERFLTTLPHAAIDALAVARRLEWYAPADIEQAFANLGYEARRRRLTGDDRAVTQAELEAEFERIHPSTVAWLRRALDRVRGDPTLLSLLGAELEADLARFQKSTEPPAAEHEFAKEIYR